MTVAVEPNAIIQWEMGYNWLGFSSIATVKTGFQNNCYKLVSTTVNLTQQSELRFAMTEKLIQNFIFMF